MKTACRETSEKRLPIAVSKQVLTRNLFENRFWHHRHGSHLFSMGMTSRARSLKFSRLSLISLFYISETRMRYPRRSAGPFATNKGLHRLVHRHCSQGKAKKYFKLPFFVQLASVNRFLTHKSRVSLHEAIWSRPDISSVDVLSPTSAATQLQTNRVQAYKAYSKQTKLMLLTQLQNGLL